MVDSKLQTQMCCLTFSEVDESFRTSTSGCAIFGVKKGAGLVVGSSIIMCSEAKSRVSDVVTWSMG